MSLNATNEKLAEKEKNLERALKKLASVEKELGQIKVEVMWKHML